MHSLLVFLQTITAGVCLTMLEPLVVLTSLLITPLGLSFWVSTLRYSALFAPAWLVDHGAYGFNNLNHSVDSAFVLVWYLINCGLGQRLLLMVPLKSGVSLPSVERLFRNARWLEKESAEMHDIFFTQKRDRRALFLVAILFWGVLLKNFPVNGFYELVNAPLTSVLTAVHITLGG